MADDWEVVTDKKYKNKKRGGKMRQSSGVQADIYENGEEARGILRTSDVTRYFDKLDEITDKIQVKNDKIAVNLILRRIFSCRIAIKNKCLKYKNKSPLNLKLR